MTYALLKINPCNYCCFNVGMWFKTNYDRCNDLCYVTMANLFKILPHLSFNIQQLNVGPSSLIMNNHNHHYHNSYSRKGLAQKYILSCSLEQKWIECYLIWDCYGCVTLLVQHQLKSGLVIHFLSLISS